MCALMDLRYKIVVSSGEIMYTRLPCRNTASLIFLFIVSVILLIQRHDSFTFCGHDGSAFLQCLLNRFSRQGYRVRSSLGLDSALCSDCSPSSRQLTCLRGLCLMLLGTYYAQNYASIIGGCLVVSHHC